MNVPPFVILSDKSKPFQLFSTLACLFLLGASLQAQTPAPASKIDIPFLLQSAPVLDSQEVDLGTRSIIYNRVAEPELKSEPVSLVSGPEPVAYLVTAEDLAEVKKWESMRHITLSMSCTAIEGTGLTELRWREGDKEMVAWSTLNFSHLPEIFDFGTDNATYSLMFMVQTATLAEIETSNAEVQRRSLPSNLLISVPNLKPEVTNEIRKSAFQFASPSSVPVEVRQMMDDLHLYVDAHRDQLSLQHQEREAVRLAQEKDLRENPPQPIDTVIQYFPIRNHPTIAPGPNQ